MRKPFDFVLADKVATIKQAIVQFSQMLSDNYSIEVRFQGLKFSTAKTKGGRTIITLPDLDVLSTVEELTPERLLAMEEFLSVVFGSLYHEVGHELFSDWDLLERHLAEFKRDKLLRSLQNIAEDSFVERRMLNRFPGASGPLTTLIDWIVKRVRQTKEGGGLSEVESEILQRLTHIARRGYRSQDDAFVDDDNVWSSEALEIMGRVPDELLEQFANCQSTQESLDTARAMKAALNDAFEEQKPDNEDNEDNEDKDKGDDSNDSDGEENGGDSAETDGEDSDEGQNTDEGDDGGEDSSEDTTGGSDEGDGEPSEPDKPDWGNAETIGSDDVVEGGLHEILSGAVDKYSIKRWLPYSTRNDIICFASPEGSAYSEITLNALLAAARKENQAVAGEFSRCMRKSLVSKSKGRTIHNQEEGELEPGDVYRVAMGERDVFSQRYDVTGGRRICIAKLIDISQSMSIKSRIDTAKKANILFGDFLQQFPAIKFMVAGYSTNMSRVRARRLKASVSKEEQQMFTRWGELYIKVFKDFKEPWRRQVKYLTEMEHKENSYTGEAIMWALERMFKECPGSAYRRIVFVWEDGESQPNWFDEEEGDDFSSAIAYHKDAIAFAATLGVEIIGVGVQSNHISEYYKDYIQVNELGDLDKGKELEKLVSILTSAKV